MKYLQAKKFADEAVDKDQYGVIKERVTSFLMRNRISLKTELRKERLNTLMEISTQQISV